MKVTDGASISCLKCSIEMTPQYKNNSLVGFECENKDCKEINSV